MKCYQWKKTAIECSLDQIIRTDLPMLVITTDEEIKADPHLDQMLPEGSKKENRKSKCYAENHTRYISGHLKDLKTMRQKHIEFRFILFSKGCILISISSDPQLMHQALKDTTSPFDFFVRLLEKMHEHDYYIISELEEKLDRLEDEILDNKLNNFDRAYSKIRFKIRHSYRHYQQLEDFCDKLLENHINLFDMETISALTRFSEQAERTHDDLYGLREYSMQIGQVHESQIDQRENHIMKILTTVTILFSPATLIVGWYGMNFTKMPELQWDLGYLFVILLSISATVITFLILKIKKFF